MPLELADFTDAEWALVTLATRRSRIMSVCESGAKKMIGHTFTTLNDMQARVTMLLPRSLDDLLSMYYVVFVGESATPECIATAKAHAVRRDIVTPGFRWLDTNNCLYGEVTEDAAALQTLPHSSAAGSPVVMATGAAQTGRGRDSLLRTNEGYSGPAAAASEAATDPDATEEVTYYELHSLLQPLGGGSQTVDANLDAALGNITGHGNRIVQPDQPAHGVHGAGPRTADQQPLLVPAAAPQLQHPPSALTLSSPCTTNSQSPRPAPLSPDWHGPAPEATSWWPASPDWQCPTLEAISRPASPDWQGTTPQATSLPASPDWHGTTPEAISRLASPDAPSLPQSPDVASRPSSPDVPSLPQSPDASSRPPSPNAEEMDIPQPPDGPHGGAATTPPAGSRDNPMVLRSGTQFLSPRDPRYIAATNVRHFPYGRGGFSDPARVVPISRKNFIKHTLLLSLRQMARDAV